MLSEVIGGLLPAAAAVALSPIPIIAVVVVLGTPRARSNGPLFAVGWVVGMSAASVVVLLVTRGASDPDSVAATGVGWGQVALGVLFFAMAARQWKKRPQPGADPVMPSWMATLDNTTPSRALVLGSVLSAANPKNLALVVSAAATIAQAGLTTGGDVAATAVFVAIGSSTVVGAVLMATIAPRRAAAPLAAVKEFMAANSVAIMLVILVVLGAKFVGDGLGVLGG